MLKGTGVLSAGHGGAGHLIEQIGERATRNGGLVRIAKRGGVHVAPGCTGALVLYGRTGAEQRFALEPDGATYMVPFDVAVRLVAAPNAAYVLA